MALVDRLEPPRIIVRVADDVHVACAIAPATCSAVPVSGEEHCNTCLLAMVTASITVMECMPLRESACHLITLLTGKGTAQRFKEHALELRSKDTPARRGVIAPMCCSAACTPQQNRDAHRQA